MPKLDDENRQHRSGGQRVLDEGALEELVRAEERQGRVGGVLVFLGVLLVAVALVSLCIGRYAVSLPDVCAALGDFFSRLVSLEGFRFDDRASSVVVNVRLPRILAAILVGASLAIAGASYQGVFRNPMVSSDILGASAGAGFGASLAILLGAPGAVVQLAAFACGLLAVAVTCAIGGAVGKSGESTLVLVLAGMVVQALFQSFVGVIKYVADPYSELPEITYWLMGSLSTASFEDVALMLVPMAAGIAVLIAVRWRINVLSFGDEEAAALGVDTRRLRLVIIVCATLVTSSAVSVAGQVGWIGLVIPHLARMIVGPNYKHLLPASLLMGGSFLLIVDDVARSVAQAELPLGVLTAIVGAPVFVFLLIKGKRGWA